MTFIRLSDKAQSITPTAEPEDYLEEGVFEILEEEDWTLVDPLDQEKSGIQLNCIFQILSQLTAAELGRYSLVCRSWKALAEHDDLWNALDLEILFSKLSIIDEQVWKELVDLDGYGLSFDDLQPINRGALIPHLKDFSSLPIEEDAGFTLLTIPQGFSFNKLIEIGGPERFRFINSNFINQAGGHSATQSCRVLISNHFLLNSRNKFVARQQLLVQQYNCEMPSAEIAAALLILTHMKYETRLLGSEAYTRSSTEINGIRMIVGSFGTSGLRVNDDCFDSIIGYGVVGVRKLF